jgi:hypothetical protein
LFWMNHPALFGFSEDFSAMVWEVLNAVGAHAML